LGLHLRNTPWFVFPSRKQTRSKTIDRKTHTKTKGIGDKGVRGSMLSKSNLTHQNSLRDSLYSNRQVHTKANRPDLLNIVPINLTAMSDPQNQITFLNRRINHPPVAHAKLKQTRKLTLQLFSRVPDSSELPLNSFQHTLSGGRI
jgi:hypothetical protein